jgi:seryl-tRNA synthetase
METLETGKPEIKLEKQRNGTKNAIRTLDELGKEIEEFGEEKSNLLEIEKKLSDEMEKETKRREKKRDQLRTEVDSLKKKCEELTGYVNTFRREKPAET